MRRAYRISVAVLSLFLSGVLVLVSVLAPFALTTTMWRREQRLILPAFGDPRAGWAEPDAG